MKINKFRKTRETRKGAALVEMALVLPIFFAVTLGIVEFGRAMMVGQLVTNAAREGARIAVLDGSSNGQVVDVIKTFLQESINVDPSSVDVDITVTAAPGNENPGNQLSSAQARDLCKIEVSVPFNEVSYISAKYLKDKSLRGHASMRHE